MKEWEKVLEKDFDLICEGHLNNTGIVVDPDSGGSHLHCEDKWWVEQQSTEKKPVKIGGSPEQQKIIDYAWNTYKDKTFIYLLEAENGLWTPDRIHNPANNTTGTDHGLCGMNDTWFSDIIWEDGDRFFWDYKWQVRECYRLYTGGTKFYGLNNIGKSKLNFEWK